jgi:hypothetical protein
MFRDLLCAFSRCAERGLTWVCHAELVSKVHIYTSTSCPAASISPDGLRLAQAARFVTRILCVLGLSDGLADSIGFSSDGIAATGANVATTPAVDAASVCHAFTAFCGSVEAACGSANAAPFLCQGLKVDALVGLGADDALDRFAEVRDKVREYCRSAAEVKSVAGAVLGECDRVRDETLVDIGVKLEDKPEGAVWMRVDPVQLRNEVRFLALAYP